ncbi:hypothetical protein K503DRAFT_577291 [Rhizopogon vinicolor AM-OR11-026]|uniref:Uncharacterized protein n=1 Tax=Rhizopogon vinicolor AM-OR11-026 TaxID=1314800 RepID=A0A1B7MJJ6_9AGAM|nr:hypothetical protein K503DRAFT_577291 [Rhizopogon vinicolor AM-OR11-026]
MIFVLFLGTSQFELIWRQRFSFMTIIYLCMRYIGILYSVIAIFSNLPSVSLTNTVVIMINRLYAMYQRSRKILIFLVITFLAVTITSIVMVIIQSSQIVWDEVVISGAHHCTVKGGNPHVIAETWILNTVWEVLALCFALWIAAKHFLELQRSSTGRRIVDCFVMLIKTHVLYFAAFAAVSFFNIGLLSPKISVPFPVGLDIYDGILRIVSLIQMFVLGPRLILSAREYLTKATVNSDEGTCMTTIVFVGPLPASSVGCV